VRFHARIGMCKRADGAADGAGGDFRAGGDQALAVAGEFGVVAGEFQAKAGRLGMDAVAAADGERVLVGERR
jgi:hypothetical protein